MDVTIVQEFRKKLGQRAVIGPFIKSSDPAFVEAAGYAGMDFVVLDMEHGPVNFQNMQNNIRAATISRALPVVRTFELSEVAISKALDIGAMAVQIPQVSTPQQARDAVRFARFYPKGERGVCRFVRAADYSAMPRNDYFAAANQALLIIQLEGKEAIENLDEILDVQGIDLIFIGPYDLSQSLGVPGDVTNPLVIQQMQKIVARAKERGIFLGTFTDSLETMKLWKDAGVNYISYSVDVGIFCTACKSLVESFSR